MPDFQTFPQQSGNSQVIWTPQPGPQTDLVTCPVFEVFFGGARGGGKTEGSIGDWFSHSGMYGEQAAGLFIRRKLTQLTDAIKRFKRYGAKIGAKWHEQKKELCMPNGAVLKFAYLERDDDAEEYQGHEYTRVYVEEVTNFPTPGPINKMKGTLRSAHGVPCGLRLTGNPGGPGHQWVKSRYIDPDPKGYLVITEEEDIEIGDEKRTVSIDRVFIPSKLRDNPKLLENDPTYILRLRQTGSESLVNAWLNGDWSGVDGVFFSEFSEAKHVIRGKFTFPPHWTVFRAFDWGSAKPFSVGWYCVSDGTIPGIARGALIKFREWYGWNGKPNEGLKLQNQLIARGILARETGLRISYGVADPAIFATQGGPSIAEQMVVEGASFFRADNSRLPGWEQIRRRLSPEQPLLLFHESCEAIIRTIPYVQHDDSRMEDLDTDSEDHALDETRYAVMSRPAIRDEPKLSPFMNIDFSNARAMPTINELIAASKKSRLSEQETL